MSYQYGLWPALLIALLAGFLIYFIMGSAKPASAMAMRGIAAANIDQEVGAELGRAICEAPPMPCIKGDSLGGMLLGDRSLYPGSYLPPTFFNTGAYSLPCDK